VAGILGRSFEVFESFLNAKSLFVLLRISKTLSFLRKVKFLFPARFTTICTFLEIDTLVRLKLKNVACFVLVLNQKTVSHWNGFITPASDQGTQ